MCTKTKVLLLCLSLQKRKWNVAQGNSGEGKLLWALLVVVQAAGQGDLPGHPV